MGIHRKTPLNQRHKPWKWEFADQDEMDAVTGIVSSDVYQLALKLDDNSVHILLDVEPTWQAMATIEE